MKRSVAALFGAVAIAFWVGIAYLAGIELLAWLDGSETEHSPRAVAFGMLPIAVAVTAGWYVAHGARTPPRRTRQDRVHDDR